MSHLLPLDPSVDYYGAAIDSWPYHYGAEQPEAYEDYVESQQYSVAGPSGEQLSSPADSATSYQQHYSPGYALSSDDSQHVPDTHASHATHWHSERVYGTQQGFHGPQGSGNQSILGGAGTQFAEYPQQAGAFSGLRSSTPPPVSTYSTLRGATNFNPNSNETPDASRGRGVMPTTSAHGNGFSGPADQGQIARGFVAPWQDPSEIDACYNMPQRHGNVQYSQIPAFQQLQLPSAPLPASQQLQLRGPPLSAPQPTYPPVSDIHSPVEGTIDPSAQESLPMGHLSAHDQSQYQVSTPASPPLPPPPCIPPLMSMPLMQISPTASTSRSPEPVVKQEFGNVKEELEELVELPEDSHHAAAFTVVSPASQMHADTTKLHASPPSSLQGALGPVQGTSTGRTVVASGPYPTTSTSMQSQTPVPLKYSDEDDSPVQTPVATPSHRRGGASGSRRGGIAKKPKKEQFLAFFFCRGRKIACGHPSPDNPDRTCKYVVSPYLSSSRVVGVGCRAIAGAGAGWRGTSMLAPLGLYTRGRLPSHVVRTRLSVSLAAASRSLIVRDRPTLPAGHCRAPSDLLRACTNASSTANAHGVI
ncbi:hypothetical protein EVG20_g1994 [Dentipellis fragilis]|uniref:Uncharacterized protein n=1 Tax=Dentipellis fragilis TaxID=205917 RepID=A0A4Y9Z985_9AGAM|nr:hypothetical protein EVG20_g1994 [Dentipellis fragilis]